MTAWLTIAALALRVFGALVDQARASRQSDESKSAALARVLNDALATIEKAKAARADAAARDAAPGGLQQPDGFRRD
ncbi:hypothetical protein [Labrys sp. WJW]|uniref:hypothetical protein n=1 Tax=Labrys sp. WJW TaxID=1737983 RepID=UPI0012E9ED5F|nr:hypothetical protein [Labrys sp. WJW]